MDNFDVTLNSVPIFTDTFSTNQVLAGGGGAGTVLPSGVNFSNGTPAHYQIIGTLTETGGKAVFDTALGAHLTQSPPFFPSASADVHLADWPADRSRDDDANPLSLTRTSAFATSGLFNLSVPATLGGFYQVNLSDRVQSNFGMGDVIRPSTSDFRHHKDVDARHKAGHDER